MVLVQQTEEQASPLLFRSSVRTFGIPDFLLLIHVAFVAVVFSLIACFAMSDFLLQRLHVGLSSLLLHVVPHQ